MYKYLLVIVGAKHSLALPLSQSMTLYLTINVLLPKKNKKIKLLKKRRTGRISQKNIIIKTKIIIKYYYRKNIINKNYKILLPE